MVLTTPSTPTWLDGPAGPLAGWLHLPPDGSARGGVVLCRPIGRESIITDRAMRVLAHRIAAEGFVALRFDYPGTGDSADAVDGLDGVARCVDGIRLAAEFLRSGGCSSISLVGLRIGATLAATAAGQCGPLSALVVWDPVSGRTFLREQRALQILEIGVPPARHENLVEALGFTYPAWLADELRTLDLPPSVGDLDFAAAPAGQYLLLTRPEHASRHPAAALRDAPETTHAEAPGQADLIDKRSFAAVTPHDTISRIVAHLAAHAPRASHRVQFPLRDSAVVCHTASGQPVTERLTWIGAQGTFAVVTEMSPERPGRPTLLCANVAGEPHIGPGRAWVEFARRGAAQGMRVLRVDNAGIGESGYGDPIVLYTPPMRDAAIRLGRWLHETSDGPVGMVGSCSGSWEAATAGGAVPLDTVWLINHVDWARLPRTADGIEAGVQAEAIAARTELPSGLVARTRRLLRTRLPYPIWLTLCRAGLAQTPELLLKGVARQGTRIRVLLCPTDGVRFTGQRGEQGVARLRRRGADITISHVQAADHALFGREGREAVLSAILTESIHDFGGAQVELIPAT
jgi:alpha-beta hydrolase superfamily lysophospholipase